ncbi:MAG TPA: CapA family protein, partial [Anaerolineaceae bacterium]|nr:CapA family protein [Anaerolineaceae bacterium]
ASIQITPTPAVSLTPFQPVLPTQTPVPSQTPTPTIILVGLAPSLPPELLSGLAFSSSLQVVEQGGSLRLDVLPTGQAVGEQEVTWVYALVAPFPTILDGVNQEELLAAWQGQSALESFSGKPLLLSAATRAAFEQVWGSPGEGAVQVLPADQLLDAAWAQSTWALVGFEDLDPRWKVLRVEGLSPLDKNLEISSYPLALHFGWHGDNGIVTQVENEMLFPPGNRDSQKMTVVVMTGVTALTRATGWKMELNGMEYPARDILAWLKEADLLHISNEVSFNPLCEPADPAQPSLMFCSAPRYIELLDYIGADVIELSGNHNVDRGMDAFVYSLDLYRQRGWGVYVGGMNLAEARKPLLVEHNGNRLAFLGCNLAGPERVWATVDAPGEASCDYEYIDAQLASLRAEGYLPIFTYQYYESYSPSASTPQKDEFRARAEAGAVIVQGSQAHRPQGMEFAYGAFIHHGLGNLFFDQMEVTGVTGTRDEFIDRHVFYNGRYIGVELLTAMLEDYARPRPMTAAEREVFLAQMFKASGW